MEQKLPKGNTRRGSLSLSQTLSFDWTPPPPPADLEQIHATSSQAPGLTSFALGSPPIRDNEPISFNKLYSRVKSLAGAIRDNVVPSSSNASSPTRSMFGNFGGDSYRINAESRDSVVSLNTSDGGSDPKSPNKTQFSHLRGSRPGSRSSSLVSGLSGEYAPPAALRKTAVLGGAQRTNSTSSIAPVTVFRSGLESYDGANSGAPSRTASTTNLQNSYSSALGSGSATPTIGALVGPVNSIAAGTAGVRTGPAVGGERITSPRSEPNLYIDVDQDSDDASDETLSDSSDDDVVMLHSKLPAGTVRSTTGQTAKKKDKKPGSPVVSKSKPPSKAPSARASPALSRVADKDAFDNLRLPPAATTDAIRSPDPNLLTPGSRSTGASPSAKSPLLPSRTSDRSGSRPLSPKSPEAGPSSPNRPPAATASELLPGFNNITSEHSNHPGTSHNGSSTAKNHSASHEEPFDDRASTRTASGTHGGGLTGSTEAVSQALRQLRMGNLTRDFWMKDELCKDCFLCGATFTAWRRKHHCRLCGQIFCSKCTTLISGDKFQHKGSMRVCKPCLDVVNEFQDESESGDDFSPFQVYGNKKADPEPQQDPSTSTDYNMPQSLRPRQTPLMAIPATRRTAANNPNRRSQILEIDSEMPSPPRPTSSRSTAPFGRPATAGSSKLLGTSVDPHGIFHRGHKHSRSQHRLSGYLDDRAPFHRQPADDKRSMRPHSAWGAADTVIDPDLAPYMTDEDTDDEQILASFQRITPHAPLGPGTAAEPGPSTPGGVPMERTPSKAPSIRARRAKSKSRGSIAGLTLGEGIKGHQRSVTRRRAQSFIAPLPARPGTRGRNRIMRQLNDSISSSPSQPGPSTASPRATRGGSSRGPLIPTVELNSASLEHVRKMLRQLLSDAEVKNIDQWERALIPILLKCTDDLNPDIRAGDSIDIRHYVKVKRIPGGRPTDTSYVSGVVFTKNLALKSMARNIPNPRIAIIAFPVEYKRRHMELMSLEPVIAQEKEFLQNLVNRIISLGPNLLLVENNISGYALQLLAQAKIATAYLVKPSVVEAVARCAQADVFSSIDKLALSTYRLGKCASFDVKTFVSDDIPGRKKTFMFLSGCQKELGCTIVLRGADMNTLAVLKQITEMMVYVVYNLKLETCLMRDEFVVIPSSAGDVRRSGSVVTMDAEKKEGEVEKDKEEGKEGEKEGEKKDEDKRRLQEDFLPDDIPPPTFYSDLVRKHETKVLSASPFVSYMQPYLLMRARGLERRLVYLRRLRDSIPEPKEGDDDDLPPEEPMKLPEPQVFAEAAEKLEQVLDQIDPEPGMAPSTPPPELNVTSPLNEKDGAMDEPENEKQVAKVPPPTPRSDREKFKLVDPELIHSNVKQNSKKEQEVLRAIYEAEYDKTLYVYENNRKQWESYLSQYDYLFDPFAHQNIAVLYSMVCTVTAVPCEGPEIRRLEFYAQDDDLWSLGHTDCTLGQYVEYLCETADHPCTSGGCDRKMMQHHRSYVHGQARVSVSVTDNMPCPITGMQGTILMWSYCKKCPNTNTPAIPMSESSWKYSFGKYLELAFWSSEMKIRSGNCPHDLNRDHGRCFGYMGKTVYFQYDTIELLEIVVPRTKITFKPEIDLRIKNEQYTQHEDRINRFFNSVKSRLAGINIISVPPEKHDECVQQIAALQQRANEDHTWLIEKLQEKYNKSKYYEIVPLNRALRAVQEKVVEWDAMFAAFDEKFFPSEKDIRRLAALQFKKIFSDSMGRDEEREKKVEGGEAMSPEQAKDVLSSVVEEDQEKGEAEEKPAEKHDEKAEVRDVTASQELPVTAATTPAVEMPERELMPPPQPEAPKSEGGTPTDASRILGHTVSLPVSPIGDLPAAPTSAIMAEIQSRGGMAEAMKKARVTPNPRSGIPVPEKKRRPVAPGRTVSVPDVRRKDAGGGLASQRSPTLPTRPRAERKQSGLPVDKKADAKKEKLRPGTIAAKVADKASVASQIPRTAAAAAAGLAAKRGLQGGRASTVSSLAKHFEQLSKEFERERAMQKKQLQAKRARALPVATSRPIVEVFSNVNEAVEEVSDEEEGGRKTTSPPPQPPRDESNLTEGSDDTFKTVSPELSREHTILTEQNPPTAEPSTTQLSRSQSDAEVSDAEPLAATDHETVQVNSIGDVLERTDSIPLDQLPQQHKSWLKTISNFWAERSASGWTSLDYPLYPTDHVFNDSDIIVREDEPSSLIAFALNGQDYAEKLQEIHNSEFEIDRPTSREWGDEPGMEQQHPELERSLLKTTGTHLKYQFQEGTAKMFCKIFYAEQFDALRRNCGISDRYVESLSRCTPWDSKGGKSRSVFLKTLDERIILKSLSPIETAAFVKFAPAYFQFMAEAFFHELPTVIAKMLGFYQISIKNPTTGTELKWDILVMENLFYDVRTTRIFDLKGSMRNRYTHSTGSQNEVLLDENMVEFIYESPLFVREHSKKLLRHSLWNDTLFLSRQNVMDYSLMIGIDEERKELVVGIIDCIRTFTWDKKLESWVKEKGLAGGGRGNKPTVTSPREYKHRFREAMERYVLEAPSCWQLGGEEGVLR